MRSRAKNLKVSLGFDAASSEVKTGQNDPVKTKLPSFNFNPTFDIADSTGGVTMLDMTVFKGLDLLDATKSSLDVKVAGRKFDAQALRLAGSITRLQTFSGLSGLTVQGSVTGQYAMAALPESQEFSFGGRGYGRGFDSGKFSADNGVAGKLELGFNIPQDALKTLKPYAFVEYGMLWNRDDKISDGKAFVAQKSEDTLSAASFGLGLKVDVLDYVSAYVEGTKHSPFLMQQRQNLEQLLLRKTKAS